jgi:hypothetical protein
LTFGAHRPYHAEPSDLKEPLPIGAEAPPFTLPDFHGNKISLREGTPKAFVVVWTCNHCPWALAWHERIQQVARDYMPRRVRFLQINANDPKVSPRDASETCRKRVEANFRAHMFPTRAKRSPAFAQSALVNNFGNFIHDVADLERSVHFYHDVLGMDLPRPRAIGRLPREC